MGTGASKAAFRDVLSELDSRDIAQDDTAFWEQIWKTSATPYDVFEVISPATVRKLKVERPGNMETLLRVTVAHLEKVLAQPDPVLFTGAMTGVRILTRLLPFLLEAYTDPDTGEVDGDLDRLFWTTTTTTGVTEGVGSDASEGGTSGVALGSAVVSVAMRMLFMRGLTVDIFSIREPTLIVGGNNEEGEGEEGEGREATSLRVHDASLLWVKGLSAAEPATIQYGRDLESNRVEVMRLLLVLLCEPLYQRNVDFDPTASRFAQEVCKADAPFTAELFFSLLSVISTYDTVGWGVPYGGSFSSDLPVKQLDMAAQLLIVLLDNGKPPLPVVTSPPPADGDYDSEHRAVREDPPTPGARGYNVFRCLVLHGLREEADFKVVYAGLSRLLNNLHLSRNSYIPGSAMTVNCYQEVLVLLWQLMQENPAFTQYILKHCDMNEILVPICFLLVENRKDESKGGLIHICTFILLKLSGERLFGLAINKPCIARLPTDLPLFTGSHLDLLILTVHKMLVSGSERLTTLFHCFLTVLCNVSPYCKSMSLVASVKLVNLLELFTSPRKLYSSETNQTFVSLLLEMFSNIIQYQYVGNAHLIYAIVRRKELFESLFQLDLPTALAAAKAYAKSGAAAKKAKAAAVAVAARGGDPVEPPAVALKPGPEDKLGEAPASEAILQQAITEPAQEETTSVTDSSSGDMDDAVALRFRPTQEWLDKLRSEIPFNTIMRLLQNLAPQRSLLDELQSWDILVVFFHLIQSGMDRDPTVKEAARMMHVDPKKLYEVDELCTAGNALDEATMVHFVTNTTMVGLLPVPHPIVIRKYHPNQHTAIWFTAFMWGVVYVRNQELPMFDCEKIRLFTVTSSSSAAA